MSLVSPDRGRSAEQKVSGEALPSFCTWANYTFLLTVSPRNKSSLEKRRYKKMFQGKTIEELINSVVRAEEHARKQEATQAAAFERQYQFRPYIVRQEMVEVA